MTNVTNIANNSTMKLYQKALKEVYDFLLCEMKPLIERVIQRANAAEPATHLYARVRSEKPISFNSRVKIDVDCIAEVKEKVYLDGDVVEVWICLSDSAMDGCSETFEYGINMWQNYYVTDERDIGKVFSLGQPPCTDIESLITSFAIAVTQYAIKHSKGTNNKLLNELFRRGTIA